MSTNIARLNAAILANEHLERDFHEFKDKTEKQVQLLYNENKLLKAQNAHFKDEQKEILERLARIEPQLGFVYVDGDGDGDGVAPGNDSMSERPNANTEVDALAGSTDERASVPGAVTNGDQDPESKANSEALKSPLAESKLVIEGFRSVSSKAALI